LERPSRFAPKISLPQKKRPQITIAHFFPFDPHLVTMWIGASSNDDLSPLLVFQFTSYRVLDWKAEVRMMAQSPILEELFFSITKASVQK
jgi:hypothetical protein